MARVNLYRPEFVIASLALVMMTGIAPAQEKPADGGPMTENYVLERRDDTFVRLNKATGEMSICSVRSGQLTCNVPAEEREYYLDEMARLEERIEELETRITSLERVGDTPQPPTGLSEPEAEKKEGDDEQAARPKTEEEEKMDQEFDRAMDYMTRAMRRFFDAIKDLKEDFNESSG